MKSKDEKFVKDHFIEIPIYYTKIELKTRNMNIWEITHRCIIGLWCGFWKQRIIISGSEVLISSKPLPGYTCPPEFNEVSHIYISCGQALNKQLMDY